ncbi:MAG: hypothetical protein AAGA46_00280 [Cyanobacteria bacterium P01_F01_bin.13]
MVQFAESAHNASMRRYETACRQANASNQPARASRRQQIEDSLVEGGSVAIQDYFKLMDERRIRANCLAAYDGVSMGYAIARRALSRWRDDVAELSM